MKFDNLDIKQFVGATIDLSKSLGFVEYIEKDCCIVEHPVNNHYSILKDGSTQEIVGVKLFN